MSLVNCPLYSSKGDEDRAIADYSVAIKLNPKDGSLVSNRAVSYTNKGEFDDALADYNEAIVIDPKNSLSYVNRGTTYYAKGDFDRAMADFKEAQRIDPKEVYIYFSRGQILRARGDFDAALADFNQELKVNPYKPQSFLGGILLQRGVTYLKAGALPKALADLSRAAALDPQNTWTALWLDIADRLSNLPSRLGEASKAIDGKLWPAAIVRLYLGQMTFEEVLAVANASEGLAKREMVYEANFFYGESLLIHGDKDGARRLFEAAAADCPTIPPDRWGAELELKALGGS